MKMMKKRETRKWLLAGWLAAAVAGCDLVEYHPYDARVDGPTGLNEKNMARIEAACEGRDTVRFVMMGDTQRYYDETEAFVRHLNGREDVDFVIHGGDVADFGLTDEFLWVRDIMEGLRVPYVTLLGNHDMLGNGMAVFERVFGEENFTFMAGRNRFVCLNTNALEFDYSHPVPDFEFLYEVMADSVREVTRWRERVSRERDTLWRARTDTVRAVERVEVERVPSFGEQLWPLVVGAVVGAVGCGLLLRRNG